MSKKSKSSPTGASSERMFRNPFDGGIDSLYGNESDKCIISPAGTTIEGAGIALNDKYNEYWEGK